MWIEKSNQLYKKFIFKDFKQAWKFLEHIAVLSEKHNHHPKIINEYNIVEMYLSTHDAGNSITQKDQELANAIDAISIK